MADALIIPTTADATALTDGEDTYTPDPWGRFDLPGSLAESLLATGGWKVWEPDDAPAFGPWVPVLPTPAEAEDGDLFPCFVDQSGFGLPMGLSYRTVGPTQIEFGGSAAYMTGPTIPDDLSVPSLPASVVDLPLDIMPPSVPVTISFEWDVLNSVDGGQVLVNLQLNPNTGQVSIAAPAPYPVLLVAPTTWDVS